MQCREVEGVSEDELAEGLRNLGYRLRPDEMSILAKQVDPQGRSGAVSKYAFLASQIDWHRDDLRYLHQSSKSTHSREVTSCIDLFQHQEGAASSVCYVTCLTRKVSQTEAEAPVALQHRTRAIVKSWVMSVICGKVHRSSWTADMGGTNYKQSWPYVFPSPFTTLQGTLAWSCQACVRGLWESAGWWQVLIFSADGYDSAQSPRERNWACLGRCSCCRRLCRSVHPSTPSIA